MDPKERVQKLSSKRGMFDEHLFSMSTTRSTLHIENVELKRTQICTKLFKKHSLSKLQRLLLTKCPYIPRAELPKALETIRNTKFHKERALKHLKCTKTHSYCCAKRLNMDAAVLKTVALHKAACKLTRCQCTAPTYPFPHPSNFTHLLAV